MGTTGRRAPRLKCSADERSAVAVIDQHGRLPIGNLAGTDSGTASRPSTARPTTDRQLPQLSAANSQPIVRSPWRSGSARF